MIGQETREVERKAIAILRVLHDSPEPLGSRVIARRLAGFGIDLCERAVRYHLKLMDERGFTHNAGRRDGRSITERGVEELRSALVSDRVGFVATRIELLAYLTSLDLEKGTGQVPINTSLFRREDMPRALDIMKDTFRARFCISDLVAVAFEGERLGEVVVPPGMAGLATVSSIAISGALLKAGIPLDSRFGGLLQLRNRQPLRFIELIKYSGCSLNPAELFIASRMTCVGEATRTGDGKILTSFHQIPAACKPVVQGIIEKLDNAGFGGLATCGEAGEPVCEAPVDWNKVGIILHSGLNPVAAAAEAGIRAVNSAMSGVLEYGKLRSFWDL